MKRTILCIDLKSFYASCECLLLKKDPFTTPLVVASKTQGKGAITLAITPYLKKQGIKSRGRLFDIPKHIKYIHIHPKMEYYVKKSKEVISVYLSYVSKEDLHVYSIDEAFLDVTNYLNYYKLSDQQLANKIINDIYLKTGLHSTCGIGSNMFIAKTAMDIESKNKTNNIAKWNDDEAREKIKNINKLSDIWGIGKNIEIRLNKIGIFTVKDLASKNINILIKEFGVIGEELWNHANAIDEAIISNNDYKIKNISYGSSQILLKDYNSENIKIIIREIIDTLTKRLRNNNKVCSSIHINISYSFEINKHFNKSISFDNSTRDPDKIYKYAIYLLNKYIEEFPIRKISISLRKIISSDSYQIDLFNAKKEIKNHKINTKIDYIQNKYGNNSIVKTSALLNDSTIIDRNNKLGGHSK